MKFTALILLLSTCAFAQAPPVAKPVAPAAQPASTAPKHADKARSEIAADAAVITVPNICESEAKDCKTSVTRAEFEGIILSISGGNPASADMVMRLASQYGDMLVFAREAEKKGMDQNPATKAMLRFAKNQVLAQQYLLSLKEQSRPSEQEVQKFYDDNQAQYQGVNMQRLMIPIAHAKSKKPEELKALAEEMRKKLLAGEDAAKLELEIYTRLELKNPPQSTIMIRADEPGQEMLVKLKAGEVSDVISDGMALVIYRSEGPKVLPLATVKQEIQAQLAQQKLNDAIATVVGDRKAVLNDTYFAPIEKVRNPHQ